jgi:hypothetical protein
MSKSTLRSGKQTAKRSTRAGTHDPDQLYLFDRSMYVVPNVAGERMRQHASTETQSASAKSYWQGHGPTIRATDASSRPLVGLGKPIFDSENAVPK